MLNQLSLTCNKKHRHEPLWGGKAAAAAFYPLKLLKAILSGIQATRDAQKCITSLTDSRWDLGLVMSASPIDPDSAQQIPEASSNRSKIPNVDGGFTQITYDPVNFREVYLDEYTREPLPLELVKDAIKEELNYFNSKVWALADARKILANSQNKIIRTRWVICNKSDNDTPDIRARLVACELNTYSTDDFYASTPPLEAKRMLLSELATRRTLADGRPLEISFVDVKKAYFNGVPKRDLHLFLPKELGLGGKAVAHLRRCVYGTRDAGQIWEYVYAAVLTKMGFRRGLANPCCFHHETRQISVVVHGDDFTALGGRRELQWYEDGLREAFDIKVKGHLGEHPTAPRR